MTLGAFRFVLALILLMVIKWRGDPGEKLVLRDLPCLAGAGLTGVTLYFFCENNGVALVTASEASIIVGFIPVITMAAEWLGGRLVLYRRRTGGPGPIPPEPGGRRVSGQGWLGAFLSLAGVALVVTFPGGNAGAGGGIVYPLSGNIRGYLYMAGAVLSWVAYGFLTRPLSGRRSRIYIVFWQTLFGLIGFIPFALMERARWGRPDMPVLFHVLFLGICCSALGYWLYAQSLAVLGVAISNIFINLVPVVTVIAGFVLLGDRLSFIQWIGAALVISGVYTTGLGVKIPGKN
jgi:drug/metabolite transporter (DMT)-like permease